MALPNPVIVVPGIIANYLSDQYPLPPEDVWTVLTRNYERTALHPDDRRYEATEPARVVPGQLFEVCYRELVEELRYNLRETEDKPVPVYPFGYDWRQPLAATEAQLSDFIDEVISRTRLLRHYYKDPWNSDPKVNLVGHSMGGLIVAGYLQKRGAKAAVGKVATLAAPFDGSFEAVVKITTGTANLGVAPPSSREREAARMTPALYHLLPGRIGGLTFPPSMPDGSLFGSDAWQPTIIQTISEYARLRGREANLTDDQLRDRARAALQAMLDEGRRYRQRLYRLDLGKAGLKATDWLCVVGVDSETRVRLEIQLDAGNTPQFAFHSDDRVNLWGADGPEQRWMTGDGTVPLYGAMPNFLSRSNIVCVRPDDFGYWELVDKALAKASGFHGFIPTMDMLHRMIVRHFTGRPDTRDNTWGRRLPGVSSWEPPLELKEKP